ncbi:MAG: hypothetical protein NTX22_10440 [Ignavibacteriales bacterium]|nr:hypothetical protein [Ignavibacteriales bacterium]
METNFTFPFGEKVNTVEQKDRTEKIAFVLGVYASAVHARWIDNQGRKKVSALAVASEPYIFWKGEDADSIIKRIHIPEELGKLVPASDNFNGPSGNKLDENILSPLGLNREHTWLCDLVPHSCKNSRQEAAIKREYEPLVEKYNLPIDTLPKVPSQLTNENRIREILTELEIANSEYLILLGDEPIKWFLNSFDSKWKSLSDFSKDLNPYGKAKAIKINGKLIQVIPLAHPRQSGKLGIYSPKWYELHSQWMKSNGKNLI